MREDFEVTSLKVGTDTTVGAVKIEQHQDGSMLLSDPYIPGVKLKELFGGSVIISPAVYVLVETTDWVTTLDNNQTFYVANIPTNWGLAKPLVSATVYDSSDIMVTVDRVLFSENYIQIRVTNKEELKVILKKL